MRSDEWDVGPRMPHNADRSTTNRDTDELESRHEFWRRCGLIFAQFWRKVGKYSPVKRDSLILDAAVALRRGNVEKALALLAPFNVVLICDPAYLNLLGVIQEMRSNPQLAWQFYGVAMTTDPSYPPARHNLRRVRELLKTGRTVRRVDLGDCELRRHRCIA